MSKDPTSPNPTQMSFLEDSPVSPLALPESKPQRRTPAISGRKCLGLSKSADRLGLLEKTLLESSNWAWTKYSLTWKPKATPQGRLIFQLARSAPRTSDKGSGLLLWPTPTAMTGGGGVAPSHKNGTHGWNTAAAVNDSQSPDPTRQWTVNQEPKPKATGSLNPQWVAWLMGYPTEYLNSVPWETQSSRKSQRK